MMCVSTHLLWAGTDDMELRNLRHFVAVADTLNFRVAGERLFLTQSAITRSIAVLERNLGVQLFVRDRRGVTLTNDGAQLLERARRILSSADEFSYAARTLTATSKRHLRIGLYGNGLAELTHHVFREFCDRFPDTTLQIRDADFANGIEPLLNGEYDVAFLRAPVDLPVLHTVRLFSEPMNLLVHESHRLASAPNADIREIFDEPWVTLPPSIPSAWGASWLAVDQRHGETPQIGAVARTEGEFGAAVAYRKLSGIVPASVPRLRPHPGVAAVPALGAPLSHVAVAYPAVGYRPDAAAVAEVALSVTSRTLHLVPDAEPA